MGSLQHFIFNSDYPVEKITYFHEAEATIKAGQETFKLVIPHSLGYTPLVFGVWSDTQDFAQTQSIGSGNILDSPYIYAYEDRIEIRITGIEGYQIVGKDTKYFFRIYAFSPDDYVCECETTQQSSKPLIMNTHSFSDYTARQLRGRNGR